MAESIEESIAALAHRQHGYVRRWQLLKLGLNSDAISYRVEKGLLIPVYYGVYAVGHLPTLPLDRAAGALLACGPGAALSHQSAANLWGWHDGLRPPFHVTTPTSHRRKGIVVHRAKLTRTDIRNHQGVRVTSPARTILDLAPSLDQRRLRRIVNDAQHGYLRLAALADVLRRFPRHPGAKLLRPYVEVDTGPTRSDFEDEFRAFCAEHRLPQPLINHRVCGYEVDAWFPEQRLVVELDSWAWHKDRDSFERDRDKDANLLSAGIRSMRITWERMRYAPLREAARLRTILERTAA